MSKFIAPLFYTDAAAKYLLKHGSRFANVYANSFGDQFFGAAMASRRAVVKREPYNRTKPVYRVVVRLKNV